MLARLLIVTFISLLALFTEPAAAERRVALVLGNGDYKHAVKLPNPARDAEAMADLLRSLGFDIVFGNDLGRDAIIDKLSQFARVSAGADVALFFYAGHGMQIAGKNLIIPVDADLKSEFDAKARTIEIDQVLQDTMADAKIKLVLLDACRDNPFAKQIQANAPKTRSVVLNSGLAEMRPGEGTLIAFATGPGQVAIDGQASHSPFTRALLSHMGAPGVEIRHALTRVRAQVADDTKKAQLPWENTNLTGLFYMTKPADEASGDKTAALTGQTPAAAAPATGFDPRSLELELWNSVKGSKNEDDYKAYLEKYPTGTFADLARSRIAAIRKGDTGTGAPLGSAANAPQATLATGEIRTAEATIATEDALGLDRDAWRDLQARLTGLGFGTRGTDGRVGDGTRRGITAWQSARGYPASGYLNRLQREALLRETPAPAAATANSGSSGGGDDAPRTRSGRSYNNSGGGGSGGGSGGSSGAGAAGEFVGGVLRGATKLRLPF